ncbi:MAG TPA: response regulator transcription factor [Bacteroidia bacterium]|nr:response regulator transcription factor [Bacteroidia bacterium]
MNNTDQKILLVDDEPDILEFLSYNLKKEGYQVYTAGTGEEGIAVAKKEQPHLVLLDVMMPGVDGIEVCRELRAAPGMDSVVIAFLTARSEDYSHIAGFEAGADDYINKPIKPRVLLSRIKALLRRNPNGNDSTAVDVGKLRIDRESYLVFKEGAEISLPRKEFELLSLLASKPGKVFARDEILNKVWGDEVVVGDRTIDVHIRKLREKLGEEFIRTVKGVGYKFEF